MVYNILLRTGSRWAVFERSNAIALRHCLVGQRMSEMIATSDGFAICGPSLARSPSTIEFVVKCNGYTVTSSGRLLLTSPHETMAIAFDSTKNSAIALCRT